MDDFHYLGASADIKGGKICVANIIHAENDVFFSE